MALRADGSEFPIELTLASWSESGRRAAGVIVRDCTQRRAAELALSAAKVAAETANVAKTAFLANMSHELRTPLNGVVGLAGMLAQGPLPPREAEMAELIRASAEQLQRLLGGVLDIARIEAGAVEVVREPFHLHELANEMANLNREEARLKGLELTVQVAAEPGLKLLGDGPKISRIVGALLSNAVKFTDFGTVGLIVTRLDALTWSFVVPEHIAAATAAGVDLYLTKPITASQLLGAIGEVFGGEGGALAAA